MTNTNPSPQGVRKPFVAPVVESLGSLRLLTELQISPVVEPPCDVDPDFCF